MSAPTTLSTSQQALAAVRHTAPLIQCLTNAVTTNWVANVLLAAGATPAMVDIREEAGAFAPIASAVLINVGTPHEEQRDAMREAATAARDAGTPWVLDPVAVGALPVRTALARDLLAASPTVIRGNASEIIALAGLGGGGRGVDSSHGTADAVVAARTLAGSTGAVVAVSGAVDLVVSREREAHVPGGSELLTRVTGGGCALGAVVAAFVASHPDAFEATVAAHAFYSAAAERAAARAQGPGSFAPAFLDALALLTPEDFHPAAVATPQVAEAVR
ncbi:hydroxyethylthiazole kinase [Demequina sp.]|uniref:hydroxyethylthiazole kinase n=1 Tax=Demequina sp. TaxID=2050685 RepID=UPI003A89AB05